MSGWWRVHLHDDDPVDNVGEDQSLRNALCMIDVGSGSVHLESREWRLQDVEMARV